MEYVQKPRFLVLDGEEAIDSLHKYIEELEEKESAELTDRHKAALTKVARALITSLEAEIKTDESIRKSGFLIPLGDIKQAILQPLQKSKHGRKEKHIEDQPIHHDPYYYSQLPIAQQMR